MKNKFLQFIKKKWLRSVLLTVLLFAIIICAYLAILYGLTKINVTDIDLTKEKIYSISQETKDKLENIEEDVTIYVYNMYEYVNEFAYKYANLNSHIKVEKLENILSKTEWKENYGITDTTAFIMIQTASKEKLLLDQDLYTYDYTSYQEIDTTEEAITNAILDVTTNVKPKICFLTGHTSYTEMHFQYLSNALIEEVNEIEYIDLLKQSIPEDCKVLVMLTLNEDLTEKERDEILKYIHNGGELLLLIDPNIQKHSMPNFKAILDEYGVEVSEGIILEGDSNYMMSAPQFVISKINNSSEIVRNISMDLNVCMIYPGKLNIASEEELEQKNVKQEVLAIASSKAFYRTNLETMSQSQTKDDEEASGATLAAMLTKENSEGNESKMIIFANTVFATNSQIALDEQYAIYAINAYNNEDILLNSISYLTQREDNITIRKTGETLTTYDVSTAQTQIVLAIIFAIPVFIILVGIVVWQLRRRKK